MMKDVVVESGGVWELRVGSWEIGERIQKIDRKLIDCRVTVIKLKHTCSSVS